MHTTLINLIALYLGRLASESHWQFLRYVCGFRAGSSSLPDRAKHPGGQFNHVSLGFYIRLQEFNTILEKAYERVRKVRVYEIPVREIIYDIEQTKKKLRKHKILYIMRNMKFQYNIARRIFCFFEML